MKALPLIIVLAIIGLIVLFSASYIVDETQQVFLTQFGKPVQGAVTTPGVHFKVPFLQKARYFDKRFLEWDGHPTQVPTRDKLYISIDMYARWRIQDPLLFFQQVTHEPGAQTRLDDILDGATRNAVARHDLVEIVRSQERQAVLEEGLDPLDAMGALSPFQVGRDRIAQNILEGAKAHLASLGIELLDIRFKRINYAEAVRKVIYERMITERQRIADKFRSEGQGNASEIMGERERELKSIESEAFRQVQEIKGRADAEATVIYAKAYDQSPEAREFYRFTKTMDSYEQTLSKNDWFILSTDNEFYRYVQASMPEENATRAPLTGIEPLPAAATE